MKAPAWRYLHTSQLGVGVEPTGTQPAVPAPSGGGTVDSEARAAIAALTAVLERFGLVAPADAVAAEGPTAAPEIAVEAPAEAPAGDDTPVAPAKPAAAPRKRAPRKDG